MVYEPLAPLDTRVCHLHDESRARYFADFRLEHRGSVGHRCLHLRLHHRLHPAIIRQLAATINTATTSRQSAHGVGTARSTAAHCPWHTATWRKVLSAERGVT